MAAETWRRVDGPHHVTGVVAIGDVPHAVLTIEAGSVVCFAGGASILTVGATIPGTHTLAEGGVLAAEGTKDDPVVFTARDPDEPWAGITISQHGGRSRISHAVVEDALAGIVGLGRVDIDHTIVRRIRGSGISYGYYNIHSRISNTFVDSAGQDGSPAVAMEGGTLEHTIIRNSGGAGLWIIARYAPVRVDHCAIHGSAGDGIVLPIRNVGAVPIHYCNFEDNGGLGVNNGSRVVVDATGNWWGDAAGPLGPRGDGVSDAVDFSPHATEPISLDGLVP